MLPRIEAIRQVRARVGATQKRLAEAAGISTSMVNQIESGRSRPSYETARRIFDALARMEGESSSHTAGDFCSTDVAKTSQDSTLQEAIEKMRAMSISQMPVFDGADPVGIVSEDGILRHLSDSGGADLKGTRVSEIMDPVPPVVDHGTPANVLVPLIRYSKCILVSKGARITGIITASDTLRMME